MTGGHTVVADWPCDFCGVVHHAGQPYGRGRRVSTFCPSLNLRVYGPEALRIGGAHD